MKNTTELLAVISKPAITFVDLEKLLPKRAQEVQPDWERYAEKISGNLNKEELIPKIGNLEQYKIRWCKAQILHHLIGSSGGEDKQAAVQAARDFLGPKKDKTLDEKKIKAALRGIMHSEVSQAMLHRQTRESKDFEATKVKTVPGLHDIHQEKDLRPGLIKSSDVFVKPLSQLQPAEQAEIYLNQIKNGYRKRNNVENMMEYAMRLVQQRTSPLRTADVGVLSTPGQPLSIYSTKVKGNSVYGVYDDKLAPILPISNLADIISTSLLQLDLDSHENNMFLTLSTDDKAYHATAIDKGRSGWLEFTKPEEIDEFVQWRYYAWNTRLGRMTSTTKYDLCSALARDLSHQSQELIETSLTQAAETFASQARNIYPFVMPSVKEMNTYYNDSKFYQGNTTIINNKKDFATEYAKRFRQQHNLQRVYVVKKALELGQDIIDYDKAPPNQYKAEDYIKLPGKEDFLFAYVDCNYSARVIAEFWQRTVKQSV